MIKLSEYIQKSRTSRLDEWQMDVVAHKAKKLEQRIQELEDAIREHKHGIDNAKFDEDIYPLHKKLHSVLDKTEDKE